MSEENQDQGAADDQATDNTTNEDSSQVDDQNTDTNSDGDNQNTDNDSLLDNLPDGDGLDLSGDLTEKPEGLDDKFWDADNNKVNQQALYDELQKSEKIAKDLRAKMGKGEHKPPEKAEDYKVELPEELADLMPADDPVLKAAQETAHKYGMSQDMFNGFMAEMTGHMAKIAGDGEPAEMSDEQKADYIKQELGKLGDNGVRIARANDSFLNKMKAEGALSETGYNGLRNAMQTAEAVQGLNELRASMGGGDAVPFDDVNDGLPPDPQIAQQLSDAYESGDQQKIAAAEQLLDKRRAAGRPEKLQF